MARENLWMGRRKPSNARPGGARPTRSGRAARATEPPLIQGDLFPRMGNDGRDIGLIIEVRRSTRRKKTIEAYRNGEKVIVSIPARMSQRRKYSYQHPTIRTSAASK